MLSNRNPTDTLQIWKEVCLGQVLTNQPDLTLRQMSILLTVYLEPPPHTVRGLAERLNVSKPVITRALDSMGAIGLVDRKRDERDRRNVLAMRTLQGSVYLEGLADLIALRYRYAMV